MPRPVDWAALVCSHDTSGLRISPATAVTQWAGEALDLDLAINTLMARRAKNLCGNALTAAAEAELPPGFEDDDRNRV